MSKLGKLIIMSTRLPVSVNKVDGQLVFNASDGGLASGISAVSKTRDSSWIGWPGIASDELTQKEKTQIVTELKKYKCHPVFLTQHQVDAYYSGYCNATLWPLFHYFTNKARYNNDYWKCYKQVNELFAKEARKFTTDDSQLWVHDYQLMLLPALLRQRYKKALIGFFLHTPFPSFELFRLLPERDELLRGLLGADLVGFHTYDYVRHFLSSVQRSLGYTHDLGAIKLEDRVVQTDAFPIGIDYKKFAKAPRKLKVKKMLRSFNLVQEKTKVILAVDRADYSKGIPARLDAYEVFLKKNAAYRGKVVLILLAVPSRGDVEEYKELRLTIEQKVSRINGQYSTVDWAPISYRHQSLAFEEVSALYAMADVMLVTPLRDGMNLVAKEYVANHHKSGGVLVLSEMAGVASELTEALQVNPNDTSAVASTIKVALEMPLKEQKERMAAMQGRIANYTIDRWANDFITQLSRSSEKQPHRIKVLTSSRRKRLVKDYREAHSRLLLLDYDGTLKNFVSSPKASFARPSRRVRAILKNLSKDDKNKVYIVSGRPKNILEEFFKGMKLGLVAEHGGWILSAGQWVRSSVTAKRWKKPIMPLLHEFAARTPGATVEEKDFSVSWHYRNTTPDLAYVRINELTAELQKLLVDSEADIFEGDKVLEIKPRQMHKGAIVTELLADDKWDFIMAIGDDFADEYMFRALPERSYTINVGNKHMTDARYQLDSVSDVIDLLSDL